MLCGSVQIKQTLLEMKVVDDNVYCHILSGLGAGFFAVICGSPVDVVKSRMMGACPSHPPRMLEDVSLIIAVCAFREWIEGEEGVSWGFQNASNGMGFVQTPHPNTES